MNLIHDLFDEVAQRCPTAVAVDDGIRPLTYAELVEDSVGWAARLSEFGVAQGDRVLILGAHRAASVSALVATSRLGAVFVLLNEELPSPLLRHVIRDAQPSAVLHVGDRPPEFDHLPGGHLDDEVAAKSGDAREWAARTAAAPEADDLVSLIYTSGSTSMPKAVMSSHRQIRFAAEAIQARLRYRPGDIVYCALPLSFDYGLYQAFLCALAGSTLQLRAMGGTGLHLLKDLRSLDATVLPAVPSLAKMLVLLMARRGDVPGRLRLVTNTGAALPQHVADALRSKIDGLDVVTMFGLTECKRVSVSSPNADIRFPGSAGNALPGTTISVVDDSGREVRPGEIGELVVSGPHVMGGYWNAPQLTRERFGVDKQGRRTLRTGDLCRLDDEGNLYFEGRKDDIYKQSGFRVSGSEIEAAAMSVPGVRDAAVALPSGDGDAAALLLCTDKGLTPETVLKRLRQLVERQKLPGRVLVVDYLPLTFNGKVDRSGIAALARSS